jgi:hypothetical protein
MKTTIHRREPLPIALALALALLTAGVVIATGAIDPAYRWAWSSTAGWLNLAPAHDGVIVYDDHLEGRAWGESFGWIRLGTHTSGGPHTYANDAADTYGVNHDGAGNLSGYAWATSVGWIAFAPAGGGVTINPSTGDFDGYAWSESIGWIRFQGPAYKVNTTWRSHAEGYRHDPGELSNSSGPATSAGLSLTAGSFPAEADDRILIGHNAAGFDGTVTEDLPDGVDVRWGRVWEIIVIRPSGASGYVQLTFDINDAGGAGSFADGGAYVLLKRSSGGAEPFAVVTVVGDAKIEGPRVTFTVEVERLGSEFTLGATAESPLGSPASRTFLPLIVQQPTP